MREAPGITTWSIGDITVTRIMELDTLVIPPFGMVKADHQEVKRHDWLVPHFATPDGDLKVHIQAFVIETDTQRILVDPCCGNDKPRRGFAIGNMLQTAFLDNLASAGCPAESIDVVLCTHLHIDHVGWNTRLVDGKWVPSFPNARYLFNVVEHDHALAEPEEEGAMYEDSVRPVLDAGQADFVAFNHVVTDGIKLVPAIGHTPGHCAIEISSNGKTAIITGDLIHHPVQAASLTIDSNFCFDPATARETRKALLARIADTGTVLLGTHFADPVAVAVKADGAAWRFEPAASRTP